jgi:hypothetical protein
VRAFILIPLIGYWIIFNEHVVSNYSDLARFIDPIHPCNPCEQKPPPWRLLALYFGLCWIGTGSLLYQALCARIIKAYPDPTAYSAAYVRNVSGTEMDRVEKSLEAEPVAAQRAREHRSFFEGRKGEVKPGEPQIEMEVRYEFWRNLLQEQYDLSNRRCFPGRVLVAFCYGAGLLILTWPTLDVFFRVAGVLKRAIW